MYTKAIYDIKLIFLIINFIESFKPLSENMRSNFCYINHYAFEFASVSHNYSPISSKFISSLIL